MLQTFKSSLKPINNGTQLRGELTISFYYSKEVKEWMGLVAKNLHVCFETWRICVILLDRPTNNPFNNYNNTPLTSSSRRSSNRSSSGDQPSYDPNLLMDPSRNAYDCVVKYIMSVLEAANHYTDHIPTTVPYDYELKV